eukprot:2924327-Rhodomonas_salina.3
MLTPAFFAPARWASCFARMVLCECFSCGRAAGSKPALAFSFLRYLYSCPSGATRLHQLGSSTRWVRIRFRIARACWHSLPVLRWLRGVLERSDIIRHLAVSQPVSAPDTVCRKRRMMAVSLRDDSIARRSRCHPCSGCNQGGPDTQS